MTPTTPISRSASGGRTTLRPGILGGTCSWVALALFMVVAGAMHFLVPRRYESIVPGFPDHAGLLVAGTGVAEMAGGVLLAFPRTRRFGAWMVVGLLVGVWPANWKMAFDGGLADGGPILGNAALAWCRVPLQLPLIAWAYRVARRA